MEAFGQCWAECMWVMALQEANYKVTERLCELVDDSIDGCLATQAVRGSLGPITQIGCLLRLCTTMCIATMCAAAAKCQVLTSNVADHQPCMWCGDASDHATMVLCDRCNACYHPQCAADSDGTKVHRGPCFGTC